MDNQNQPPKDDIDALVTQFGGGFKPSSKEEEKPKVASPEKKPEDEVDALISQYGGGFKKKGETETKTATTAPTDEYEARVQKFMPEAKKRMAALGTLGGIETGIHKIPIVGPIVSEIGADIAAALPRSLSEAEGETYGERRQNIKAGIEAMKRAGTEQNPYISTGTEIAGSFALPLGGLAKIGEAATGSKLAGLAIEGGGIGAATAGAEKIGTSPEKEQPSVGESALLGGALGGTLGLVGKGVSKAVEKVAPDWMKSMGAGRDNYQFREFAKAFDQDVKEGNVRMSFDDYQKALAEGQPVAVTDLGGPRVQDFIKRAFHDQPELARDFQIKLQGRLMDAGRRFDEFAQGLADSDLNVDAIAKQARKVAQEEKQKAYDLAINDPENGRGAWKPEWNEYINLPLFKDAIRKTEDDLANDVQYGIGAARRTAGDTEEIVSPFRVESVSPGRPRTRGGLEREVYVMDDPSKVNMKYLDYLQRNLNDAIDNISGNARGGVKARMISIRDEIVDSLTNPESSLYNEKYAKAYGSTQFFRGENDAFKFGQSLLSTRLNPAKASKIQNITEQMTEQEKKLFTQGVLAKMLAESRLADGSIDTNKLQRFFTPGPLKTSLENAFTPQQFQDLQRFANTEGIISDAAKKAATLGGRAPQISRDLHTIMWTLLFDKIALAKFAGQYANQYMGDKYAKSLIEKLMSDDPAMIRAAYDDIANNKTIRSGLVNALGAWAGRGGLAAGQVTGQKRGGRIDYNGGGKVDIQKNKLNWHKNSHKLTKDEFGKPKVFYHGTKKNFSKFDLSAKKQNNASNPTGIYLTNNPHDASYYAMGRDDYEGANVMPLHVHAKNPFVRGSKVTPEMIKLFEEEVAKNNTHLGDNGKEYAKNKAEEMKRRGIEGNRDAIGIFPGMDFPSEAKSRVLKAGGYDSFVDGPHFVVFEPTQVKSATGNKGKFDTSKSDITESSGGAIRAKRATGGRIPEADKMFKAAKKAVDGNTKPLMKLHDDAIVQALRIAKGII